jgi:hypothetical protein
MNRIRLSTTVDAELLSAARRARAGVSDAALIDEALSALLSRHRSAEIDAGYGVYGEHPANEVVLEPDHDPIPRRSAVNLDSVREGRIRSPCATGASRCFPPRASG